VLQVARGIEHVRAVGKHEIEVVYARVHAREIQPEIAVRRLDVLPRRAGAKIRALIGIAGRIDVRFRDILAALVLEYEAELHRHVAVDLRLGALAGYARSKNLLVADRVFIAGEGQLRAVGRDKRDVVELDVLACDDDVLIL